MPPPCPKIVPTTLRGADIYQRYKQILRFKKWNIAHKIICFIIMNVIIARQKLKISAHPYTYPFESSAIVKICFEVGI